ncbi:MAG: nicotinate-nucleotide--dimethylbenzimidazole phosphoribosyltransferase [Desulfosarcina sp.]|nr:nicotinate-nucleotide--dimethylbenzimidazole phosphoribosyltransferase [Desulfosarcina sp.]MBC2743576.1 nicotinate-nucleotide--dimethylbenzimidazole phosphoribosyltransferase [Desulfosarcina sp.]MBC2766485.1 nicotinate-nucleotide--dimethylbenzimidazole phosphoribosyltransferase [Desulfosarcina sp.]
MKLVLTGLGRIEICRSDMPEPATGMSRLKVNYCGVCRTDAKMWNEGHRDLVFPRVPGHEILAEDDHGQTFTVWPGTSCGRCRYCTTGRENLCESMKIMGFHFDGGYSDYLLAPTENLIPVPADIATHRVCFAEPVGCVLNALDKLDLRPAERVVIFGGGTVGLIAALVAKTMGTIPLVIEKNAEKIAKASSFLEAEQIPCLRETTDSEFDVVVNACPDPIAFCQGVAKLGKGGRFSFFSGLTKNQHIETNLVNLMHYKEAAVYGAYGLNRRHMVAALDVIRQHQAAVDLLVESIILPDQLTGRLPDVLSGRSFKIILDFTGEARQSSVAGRSEKVHTSAAATGSIADAVAGSLFMKVCNTLAPISPALLPAARQKMDNKTKPLGALGRLEELAIQLCLIQQTLSPQVDRRALFVFAADHGITEEGVSAYPSEVTGQMVKNFLDGGAAINVLCRHHGIDMRIVDMGVNADLEPHSDLVDKKVRRGTHNFALEPAMTREEAIRALEAGMECFFDAHTQRPIHIIGLGEMGIGNTTSASAIISVATGITPAQAAGRGTGIDDAGVRHKIKVIQKVLDFHRPDPKDGLDILCKVGGFEIAGIAGAALAAASKGVAVVLDGVISTAAGLIAHLIRPEIGGYLISGHRSVEIAQTAALEQMELKPVVDLDMRLGEGTGAALAIDIVVAACRIMNEMASFDEAGVSKKG